MCTASASGAVGFAGVLWGLQGCYGARRHCILTSRFCLKGREQLWAPHIHFNVVQRPEFLNFAVTLIFILSNVWGGFACLSV